MLKNLCLLGFIFVMGLGVTGIARAQENVVKIAIVDVRALLSESKAAKNVADQLSKQRDKIVKILSEKEKALTEEEKSLIEARKTLSKEDFSVKAQAFEKERIDLQKLSAQYRQGLSEASLKAEKEIMNHVAQSVESVASSQGYELVLTKQNVILGVNRLDITKDVLKKLNDTVSKIKVDFSAPKG